MIRIYPGLLSDFPVEFQGINIDIYSKENFDSPKKDEVEKFLDDINVIGNLTLKSDSFLYYHDWVDDIDEFNDQIKPYEEILFFLANYDGAYQEPSVKYTLSFSSRHGRSTNIDGVPHYLFDQWKHALPYNRYTFRHEKLLDQLLEVLDSFVLKLKNGKSNSRYEYEDSILNSILWYNKARRAKRYGEESSSLIFFTSAFESFFQMPRNSKSDPFAYAIQMYLGSYKRVKDWAKSFYGLRNSLLHGSSISPEKLFFGDTYHVLHTDVASYVFMECLLNQLFLTEYLDYPIEDRKKNKEFIIESVLISNYERISNLVDQKDTFTYTSLRNDEKIAKRFFDSLLLIMKPDQTKWQNKSKFKNRYDDLIKLIRKIVIDWITELLNEKETLNINKIVKIQRSTSPVESLEKVLKHLENYPKGSPTTLYSYWYDASDLFSTSFFRFHASGKSANSNYGIYEILQFVVKTYFPVGKYSKS